MLISTTFYKITGTLHSLRTLPKSDCKDIQLNVWQLYSIKNSTQEYNEIHSLLQNCNIYDDKITLVKIILYHYKSDGRVGDKQKFMQGRVTGKKLCREEVKEKIPSEWIALPRLQAVPAWMAPWQPLYTAVLIRKQTFFPFKGDTSCA